MKKSLAASPQSGSKIFASIWLHGQQSCCPPPEALLLTGGKTELSAVTSLECSPSDQDVKHPENLWFVFPETCWTPTAAEHVKFLPVAPEDTQGETGPWTCGGQRS